MDKHKREYRDYINKKVDEILPILDNTEFEDAYEILKIAEYKLNLNRNRCLFKFQIIE
jgi:hypothetical protein